MSITRPYRRTFRQFADGSYLEGGRSRYVLHPDYAQDPGRYVHAFLLIQRDLFKLFDFVEPDDNNLACFSFRIHGLLMRTCIEIEANCRAILSENGYSKAGDWNIQDYARLNATHRLSDYVVRLQAWTGPHTERRPFAPWANNQPLPWYQAYNAAKHDRHNAFHHASLEAATDAVYALIALLTSQFGDHDFAAARPGLAITGYGGPPPGYEVAIGGEFHVRYPIDWPQQERYEFDWEQLKNDQQPIQSYAY